MWKKYKNHKEKLLITGENRDECVFARADIKDDVLYSFFRFREIDISISRKNGNIRKFEDRFIAQLITSGDVSEEAMNVYEKKVEAFLRGENGIDTDNCSAEQLYYMMHQIRLEVFGADLIEKAKEEQKDARKTFFPEHGIDQRCIIDEISNQISSVIFVLTEASLFYTMKQEMEKMTLLGKKIYLLVAAEKGWLLPWCKSVEQWLEGMEDIVCLHADTDGVDNCMELQEDIYKKRTCLFFFGEEGLISCRKLLVDSFVYATPNGYCAQAVTGQLGKHRDSVVYIPTGLDIASYVPLIDRTRLNFNVLYALWKQYGMGIYSLTPEEMYLKYPDVFVNIYEDKVGAKQHFPIQIKYDEKEKDVFSNFDYAKEKGIQNFIQRFKDLEYISVYFDKELKQVKPIKKIKQDGIYVHGIRVKCSEIAQVIPCRKGCLLREQFSEMDLQETGIASNFLFFMTKKLVHLYNNLRTDRPEEMSQDILGTLDYQLEYLDGKRVETFPLFRKTCIAMKKTGEVFLCNFRLGGGRIILNDCPLFWSKEDVDPQEENNSSVCIFTPYLSLQDVEESTRETYRKFVGQNRLNFVIYQDKIICCRMGDVVLPSIGVVLSVEKQTGLKLLEELNLLPLNDGYYDVSGLPCSVQLDGPEEIAQEDWEQVKWAYGGGLTLISEGRSLCKEDGFEQWLTWEGWTTPLSRQTQESAVHKPAKHPRTAVGTTKTGELVILTFSGRSSYSCGADYSEMCEIAKKLLPDIECMMNVDGGASSVLGLVYHGAFLELNVPSTSTESMLGMVRPINTVLYVPLKEIEQKRGKSHD